jgi:serine/threonine-protein kinase
MPPTAGLAPEVLVAGRYRLVEPLDSGSTASVWRAFDVQLERDVAIKILRDEGVDPELRTRAERESRVLASLSHPNIVRVLDGGEDEGSPYMVMELLEGESLSRINARDERLGVDEAVRMIADVADGLGAAHARGVIHRDVKPGNIVCNGNVPTLVDFGIARNMDATTLTRGLVVGTAAYLAPEQAQGKPLQPSADVYALGCVLYELLTGRAPFVGDTSVAVAMLHVHEEPVPPRDLADVPAAVDAVVMRCLAKDPDRRPVDGLALAGALRDALDGAAGDETEAIAPLPVDGTMVMPAVAAVAVDDAVAVVDASEVIDPSPLPPVAPPVHATRARVLDWRWIAAAVVLVVVGLALATGGGGIAGNTRPVPDVTNASIADATSYLEGAGMHVDVQNVQSNAPAGTVVGSDPKAGESIAKDGTVRLQVSSGPPPTTAPPTTAAPAVDVHVKPPKPHGHGNHDD